MWKGRKDGRRKKKTEERWRWKKRPAGSVKGLTIPARLGGYVLVPRFRLDRMCYDDSVAYIASTGKNLTQSQLFITLTFCLIVRWLYSTLDMCLI